MGLYEAFRTFVIFERNCLSLASVRLFEMIVLIAVCVECSVRNVESHSFDLKALWQRDERVDLILFIDGVKYFSQETI